MSQNIVAELRSAASTLRDPLSPRRGFPLGYVSDEARATAELLERAADCLMPSDELVNLRDAITAAKERMGDCAAVMEMASHCEEWAAEDFQMLKRVCRVASQHLYTALTALAETEED